MTRAPKPPRIPIPGLIPLALAAWGVIGLLFLVIRGCV